MASVWLDGGTPVYNTFSIWCMLTPRESVLREWPVSGLA